MAVRGKRTIGVGNPQGGAIGTVGIDTADTPFQTFDVPIFDGDAKALAGLSKGLGAASALFEDIAKDASNADYLTTSRDLFTTAMDMEASWSASGVSPNPGTAVGAGKGEALVGQAQGKKWNRGPALGKGANKDWFKATTEDMTVEINRITGTKEYANLTRSDRKAMDELLQKTELSYRATALLHMQTQTKIHLKGELTTALAMQKDIAIGAAGNPGAAHSRLANVVSSIQEVARMETGATLGDVAVRGAAIEAMDDVAQKSIDNLLNSQDPNRAEKARQWMAMNTTVEVDGHKITLSDDKKNDLNILIAKNVQNEVGRRLGNKAWLDHGKDNRGFNKWLAKRTDITAETKELIRAQYKDRLADEVAQEKQELQIKKTNAVKLARAGKFEQIGDAVLAQLGAPMAAALRKISDDVRRGAPGISDPHIVNELNRMKPEELVRVDLLGKKYLSGLSVRGWDHFSDKQSRILDDPSKRAATRSRVQIVTQSLKSAGITNSTQVLNFNIAMDAGIAAIVKSNKDGAEATSAQIQELADLLLINGEYKGGPWRPDPNVRVFQLQRGQMFFLDDWRDIPPAQLRNLRAAAELFGGGLVYTNADLLALYNINVRKRVQKLFDSGVLK